MKGLELHIVCGWAGRLQRNKKRWSTRTKDLCQACTVGETCLWQSGDGTLRQLLAHLSKRPFYPRHAVEAYTKWHALKHQGLRPA